MSERLFSNQDSGVTIWNHRRLPLYKTHAFDFFRCVAFKPEFYNKTVSELHTGNLRVSRADNRYSNLFPGQRLSYWADSPQTARAEAKKWGAKNNLLLFWAYDDCSSLFPTVYPPQEMKIIDGMQLSFNRILKNLERKEQLTVKDWELIDQIADEEPDCLVYESEARKGSLNFLFFEHGFRKLSLREVRLRLGDEKGKNHNKIVCAKADSYTPYIGNYGDMFLPIAKIKRDDKYVDSDEYRLRWDVVLTRVTRMVEEYRDQSTEFIE